MTQLQNVQGGGAMNDEKYTRIKGLCLDYDLCPSGQISWSFLAKRRGNKISQDDVVTELFNCGMGGNFYCWIQRVPEELDAGVIETFDIYETDAAAEILAGLNYYTLYDNKGKLLVGKPVDRVCGYWERYESHLVSGITEVNFRCSACHQYHFHNGAMRREYKYCPNCGAKMD
jgi:hypothetical protein